MKTNLKELGWNRSCPQRAASVSIGMNGSSNMAIIGKMKRLNKTTKNEVKNSL